MTHGLQPKSSSVSNSGDDIATAAVREPISNRCTCSEDQIYFQYVSISRVYRWCLRSCLRPLVERLLAGRHPPGWVERDCAAGREARASRRQDGRARHRAGGARRERRGRQWERRRRRTRGLGGVGSSRRMSCRCCFLFAVRESQFSFDSLLLVLLRRRRLFPRTGTSVEHRRRQTRAIAVVVVLIEAHRRIGVLRRLVVVWLLLLSLEHHRRRQGRGVEVLLLHRVEIPLVVFFVIVESLCCLRQHTRIGRAVTVPDSSPGRRCRRRRSCSSVRLLHQLELRLRGAATEGGEEFTARGGRGRGEMNRRPMAGRELDAAAAVCRSESQPSR